MITNQNLSDRIWQFFDVIFGSDKTQFGFNANSNLAFFADQQNDAIRSAQQTALFYRVDTIRKVGNDISSDTQILNRTTGKEEIITTREITVVVNFLSKKKGYAKNAYTAFLAYLQSTRRDVACYALPFPLVLINSQNQSQNLSELEEGAWVERIEKTLYFRYNDKVVIGDIYFTQEPELPEDVKEIIQYDINLKNS